MGMQKMEKQENLLQLNLLKKKTVKPQIKDRKDIPRPKEPMASPIKMQQPSAFFSLKENIETQE